MRDVGVREIASEILKNSPAARACFEKSNSFEGFSTLRNRTYNAAPNDGDAERGATPMAAHPVSFRVLSSVDVRVDASSVLKVAAPGQRALLAQLLVNANQTVRASTLIDGIWGGAPPQRPESALHIVVCRLRRALDVVAPR